MIIKHGDNTASISVEKTAMVCSDCGRPIIKIDGKMECDCSNSIKFAKCQDAIANNFTQKAESTTLGGKDNV